MSGEKFKAPKPPENENIKQLQKTELKKVANAKNSAKKKKLTRFVFQMTFNAQNSENP